MTSPQKWSRYFENLPRVYRDQPESAGLLNNFLLAFEAILTDHEAATSTDKYALKYALEEILDGIPNKLTGFERYFTPGPGLPETERTLPKFLDWLASWVALTLDPEWKDRHKRELIAKIVPLYRQRGTTPGMAEALGDLTGQSADVFTVRQFFAPFQVGIHAKVGVETWLGGVETVTPTGTDHGGGKTYVGGEPPFFFEVVVDTGKLLPGTDLVALARELPAVIDARKPAATWYRLRYHAPAPFTVGTSRIGELTKIDPGNDAVLTSTILVDPTS